MRITGGEPLVRRGVMTFFKSISRHLETGALKELTLTTNGSQLKKYAGDLASFGVRRINVSLDTLNEEKFAKITRWGRLAQVLDGIDAALSAGIDVKINTVAIKGENEDELEHFVRWCGERGLAQTFIEVMPMGEMGEENRLDQFWSLKDLRARLAQSWTLNDIDLTTGGPANYVKLAETDQKIGFITPLSHNFCESCNRVRVTCTGHLFQCLGQEMETDLRQVLRDNPDDDTALILAIKAAIDKKPRGHDFDYSRQQIAGKMSRHMSHTGG